MKGPNYLRKLGTNLYTKRKNSHLSQGDLAVKAHMDINYVGEIERGEANPSTRILKKISKPLKTTISKLTEGV